MAEKSVLHTTSINNAELLWRGDVAITTFWWTVLGAVTKRYSTYEMVRKGELFCKENSSKKR